ncbi:hypothetical protein [Priestia aryabhattai]
MNQLKKKTKKKSVRRRVIFSLVIAVVFFLSTIWFVPNLATAPLYLGTSTLLFFGVLRATAKKQYKGVITIMFTMLFAFIGVFAVSYIESPPLPPGESFNFSQLGTFSLAISMLLGAILFAVELFTDYRGVSLYLDTKDK